MSSEQEIQKERANETNEPINILYFRVTLAVFQRPAHATHTQTIFVKALKSNAKVIR